MPHTASKKHLPMRFKTMTQFDVPQGRNGKHKQVVTTIFQGLDNLRADSAIKVPLADLAESKEKVRSALIGRLGRLGAKSRRPAAPLSYTCGPLTSD
jgi:hypothetical protein